MARLARPHQRRLDDDAGVTLVELLVSMAILAVVLTAFAGTIVVTLRSITTTEHEVVATQYVGEVSESIQHGEFEFVALYDDEIDPTTNPDAGPWVARLDAGGTFEGQPLVTLPGPGGTRDARIPEPILSDTRGGIDVRIDRYLTWVDRDGDGIDETKRLTTFATWTDREGQPRELRFDSERVPTQAEASADVLGRRVIDFRFSPDPAELTASDGTTVEQVSVSVRTNVATILGELEVYVYDAVLDVWELVSIPMSNGAAASSGWVTWTAEVPTSVVLSNGQVDFLFTGTEASPVDPTDAKFTGTGTLDTFGGPWDFDHPTPGTDFVAGDTPVAADPDPDPTADPGPAVTLSIVSKPTELCVNATTWKLKNDATFTVETTGLDSADGTVRVTYPHYGSGGGQLDPDTPPTTSADLSMGLVSGDETSATWSVTIPRGTRFNPENTSFDDVVFELDAERNGGAFAEDRDDDSFSARAKDGC